MRTSIMLMLAFATSYIQGQQTSRNNSCTLRSSQDCNFCIQESDCGWCADPNWKGSRCDKRAWLSEDGNCGDFLQDPQNSIEILQDDPLNLDPGPGQNFVQISPQKVKLRLRPGIDFQFTLEVAQAKQYPVDLYYLMDLSNSMSDDKETIVQMGQVLIEAVRNITKDFQIGFGSFVDKEVMPFISLLPRDNCQLDYGCPAPYSFQHQMSLSSNAREFQEKVAAANISGNIDNPEGGFDALMQVMVCDKEVGWRNISRRVIIFTTDQSFHMAMDGKLGGLVTPNDGKCHLNASGFYTYSTLQDYPSIGHINHVAKENSVSIIWAVTEQKYDLYQELSSKVSGSSAGILSSNSSNIVELVKKQYEKITTSITMKSTNNQNCQVMFKPKCGGQTGQAASDGCSQVELGTPVQIDVQIRLKSCTKQVFSLYPVGINEEVLVEIDPICQCDCSVNEPDPVCGSPECNQHGHLVCGECQCCDTYFGPNCACENGSVEEQNDPDAKCRPMVKTENGTRYGPVCFGRGTCDCGECICDTPWPGVNITGQYCQTVCDNTACIRDRYGKLCSGNGQCVCGQCLCQPPWTGQGCNCKKDQDKCRNPDSPHLICSGHGSCPCDECQCTKEGYTGKYCEVCETCQNQCTQLRPCVECLAFNSTDLMLANSPEYEREAIKANCEEFCSFDYQESTPTRESPFLQWKNCTFLFGPCSYTFSHTPFLPDKDLPDSVILHLQNPDEDEELARKLNCPKPPDIIGIVLGVIGGVVGIGLVTIFMWKALTTIHDRREFARFERERMNMKFSANANPIFKQATTTIQNPIFNPHDH